MVPDHLFTLESDLGQSCSVYELPGDRLTIWTKLGAAIIEVGSIEDTENLIDLLRETINQIEQEQLKI